MDNEQLPVACPFVTTDTATVFASDTYLVKATRKEA